MSVDELIEYLKAGGSRWLTQEEAEMIVEVLERSERDREEWVVKGWEK